MSSRKLTATVVSCALGALCASSAAAQSTAPRAERVLDETETYVRLWTQEAAGGYVVRLVTSVHGVTGRSDAARLDVKQGGRVLLSQRCAFGQRDGDVARLSCETPDNNRLTATGELTVELHYIDDQTDATELLRTFNVQVRRYPDWIRGDGRRVTEWGGRHQILNHDALGGAWVWHSDDPQLHLQPVSFYLSFAGPLGRVTGSDYSLRCTVNGTRTPDIAMRQGNTETLSEVTERPNMNDNRTVQWTRVVFEATGQSLWWGRRSQVASRESPPGNLGSIRFLGENAGSWSCDLRMDGRVLRTLVFTVGADGRVAPHPEQTAPQGYRQIRGLSLIDVRLPSSPVDEFVDPAAIRASLPYGQPRRQPDAWAASLATLPSAPIGNAGPSAAPGFSGGGGGGGRRRGRR